MPNPDGPGGSWFRRALGSVTRRAGFARRYASSGSWGMSYYDAILRAFPLPLPGRRVQFPAAFRALEAPLYVRLGSADWPVAEEVFLRDVYSPILDQVPADVRSVLDLGSNIGATLRLWGSWWPQARVIAVEPDDENLAVLRRNVSAGRMEDRTRVVRACAVGRRRQVLLERSSSDAGHRLAEAGEGSAVVPGLTVEDLLATESWDAVDLLKCDIEGTEQELFANCRGWIGRVRCLAVEVHGSYSAEDLVSQVSSQGGRFARAHSPDPNVVVLQRLA